MSVVHPRVGFMQGRLSPLVEGKIQAFPWAHWEGEFATARGLGLRRMEWTIDQARIEENPLMTPAGQARIRARADEFGIAIPSLTGDSCMQAPFWKAHGAARERLVALFGDVVRACGAVGIGIIVVPLVDNGSLTSLAERAALTSILLGLRELLDQADVRICFESDFAPPALAGLIAEFPQDRFGINYDMGNSASLGWDPDEEIPMLATRILNVHVKDRVRGGSTVALGEGAANLPRQFALLRAAGYQGNYILQTARAADDDHEAAIRRYAAFVTGQLEPADAA